MNYYRGVRGLLMVVTGVVLFDANLEMALAIISIVTGTVEIVRCAATFMLNGDNDA